MADDHDDAHEGARLPGADRAAVLACPADAEATAAAAARAAAASVAAVAAAGTAARDAEAAAASAGEATTALAGAGLEVEGADGGYGGVRDEDAVSHLSGSDADLSGEEVSEDDLAYGDEAYILPGRPGTARRSGTVPTQGGGAGAGGCS